MKRFAVAVACEFTCRGQFKPVRECVFKPRSAHQPASGVGACNEWVPIQYYVCSDNPRVERPEAIAHPRGPWLSGCDGGRGQQPRHPGRLSELQASQCDQLVHRVAGSG